jgi:hypothetical protein
MARNSINARTIRDETNKNIDEANEKGELYKENDN